MTRDADNYSKEPGPLIVRGLSAAVTTVGKDRRLMSRMNQDALEVIGSIRQNLTPVMRRLGDYELHEEDYQQLNIWAQDFTEDGYPITALRLAEKLAGHNDEWLGWSTDGYQLLPWLEKGRIKHAIFNFLEAFQFPKRLDLSTLSDMVGLKCDEGQLTEINLSKVPRLTNLSCAGNPLTKIDLSNVLALKELNCGVTQLIELNLQNVPQLTYLRCYLNQLTKLDLSNVSELIELSCRENLLTSLDLRKVPKLTHLDCENNRLTELELSNVPKLTWLQCSENRLNKINLSNMPKLELLSCA